METVRFMTGFTRSSGTCPFELVLIKIPTEILAELRDIRIVILQGVRGCGKIYELILTCEKGSPEEVFLKNDPLYEEINDQYPVGVLEKRGEPVNG